MDGTEFFQWTKFGRLNLDSFEFHTLEHFKDMTRTEGIKSLWLGNQRLSRQRCAALSEMRGLRTLELDGCTASNRALSQVTGLAELRILRLRQLRPESRPFADFGLRGFAAASALRALDLGETPCTDSALAAFQQCAMLQYLDIWQTGVSERGIECVKSFPELRHIALDCVKCDPGVLDTLASTGLRGLEISGVNSDAAIARVIRRQPNLRRVSLWECEIGDQALAALADLGKLTQLSLAFSFLSTPNLMPLQRMRELRRLDLDETEVTDQDVELLSSMSWLRSLRIRGTMMKEGFLRLWEKLPHCVVDGN